MAEPTAAGSEPPPGVVRIDDAEDPRLADYRELKDPARRQREGERRIFVVEGRLAVEALVRSEYEVVSLLAEVRQADAAPGLLAAVRAAGGAVFVADRAVVARTVGFDLHRGIVAVARRPTPSPVGEVVGRADDVARAAGRRPVLAVLEGLNDHENLGGIFRNAAAFGVGGVLLDPRCADPLYRRSVRVSLGHVLAVPSARLAPLPGGLGPLRAAGYAVWALAPDHGEGGGGGNRAPLARLARRLGEATGVAVLLGAEGTGLSAGALAAADERVAIPMAPGVDSLNVATAAAIAFYELAGGLGGPTRRDSGG